MNNQQTTAPVRIMYILEGRNFRHCDLRGMPFITRKPANGKVIVDFLADGLLQSVEYQVKDVAAYVFAGLWIPTNIELQNAN